MNYGGIYQIIFDTDHGPMIYVGSSKHCGARKSKHMSDLRLGKHANRHLQRLWQKYGDCRFIVVERCDNPEDLIQKEQKWIEKTPKSQLINLGPAYPSPNLGRIWTAAERMKLRLANLGRPVSEAVRKKIAAGHKGKPKSASHARNISRGKTGHTFTEEAKRKIARTIREKGISKGANNPAARLTPKQVAEIRARYSPKRGVQTALAKEYGVSRTQIRRIINGESW